MSLPAEHAHGEHEEASDTAELHAWVAKARSIDAATGGAELGADVLARYLRILRVATAGARRDGRGRRGAARDARP